jgi:hypothetical protein
VGVDVAGTGALGSSSPLWGVDVRLPAVTRFVPVLYLIDEEMVGETERWSG